MRSECPLYPSSAGPGMHGQVPVCIQILAQLNIEKTPFARVTRFKVVSYGTGCGVIRYNLEWIYHDVTSPFTFHPQVLIAAILLLAVASAAKAPPQPPAGANRGPPSNRINVVEFFWEESPDVADDSAVIMRSK